MKKIISICVAIFLVSNVFAQSPNKMSYQAVIRNSNNDLLLNSNVGMRISILQGSASGTEVFAETHNPTTNTNGLVSIEIGGGTPVTGNFAAINWANGPYFVKTETDPNGGTSYSITGTSQLLSVPYALYSEKADTAIISLNQYWSKTNNNIHFNTGNVAVGTVISNPMNLFCLNPVAGTRDGIEFRDQNSSNFGMKLLYNEPNNQLQVVSNNNGTETDVMSFNRGTGYVGIGTSAPLQKFHLVDNGSIQPFGNLIIENNKAGSLGGSLVLSNNINNYQTSTNQSTSIVFNNYSGGNCFNTTTGVAEGTAEIRSTVVSGLNGGSNLTFQVYKGYGNGGWTIPITIKPQGSVNLKPIATAPSSPAKGDMYFDSTINRLRVYDGTTWQNCW